MVERELRYICTWPVYSDKSPRLYSNFSFINYSKSQIQAHCGRWQWWRWRRWSNFMYPLICAVVSIRVCNACMCTLWMCGKYIVISMFYVNCFDRADCFGRALMPYQNNVQCRLQLLICFYVCFSPFHFLLAYEHRMCLYADKRHEIIVHCFSDEHTRTIGILF